MTNTQNHQYKYKASTDISIAQSRNWFINFTTIIIYFWSGNNVMECL